MRKYCTVVLFFVTQFCSAQNLVNNWSFEDTVACPTTLTQIEKASGWMSFSLTPDYFNACASVSSPIPVSIPYNIWGYQNAHSGNGYAGLVTFQSGATNSREFIATQLSQALIPQLKYFVSFWVSSGFGIIQSQIPDLASNNIGVKFSTVQYSQFNPQSINNFAHFVDTNVVNDTTNWVRISGSFIADSAYTFLSIGNFYDDMNTTVEFIGTAPSSAYYYLDDVRLSSDSTFVNNLANNYSFKSIKIFPNPARDWIVVEGRNIKSIEIFDICGRIVVPKMTVSSFSTKVDVSILGHGVYILKLNTSSNFKTEKFIHY